MSSRRGWEVGGGQFLPEESFRNWESYSNVLRLKNGAFLAGMATPNDPPSELQRRGYHMVCDTYDIGLLRNLAIADLRKHKSNGAETEGSVHQFRVLDAESELKAEKLNG